MTWTTPKTWGSEILTSSDMNTYIRDDLLYLYGVANGISFTGYRVDRNSATQSIPNDTWTSVSFTRELVDAGGWTAVTSTTGTVPASAIPSGYTTIIVVAHMYATFASNSTGQRKARVLRGGSPFVKNGFNAASADTTDLVGSMWTTAVASDTFTMEVYQNSGGNLNLTDVALAICRIAPLS